MTAFKDLLKTFRERNSLTKVEMAKFIGKTDGYLRKVENGGYTPPTFEVCLELAKVLKLSRDEENQFLEAAYLERTQSEASFYERIRENFMSASLIVNLPYPNSYEDNESVSKCTYLIGWETRSNQGILQPVVAKKLRQLIGKTIREFEYILQKIVIFKESVKFIIDIKPEANISEFVKGIMELTSRKLRTQFEELTYSPTIWSHTYTIYTIGNPPDLSYFKRNDEKKTIYSK
ncbi:MAG: transposase [Candidatus Margulisbacteria bacterium]|nr:transposase [Candidatus Margulisiibacteriota bacterium]